MKTRHIVKSVTGYLGIMGKKSESGEAGGFFNSRSVVFSLF